MKGKGGSCLMTGEGGKMWAQKIALVGLIVIQSWKLKQLWTCDLA